MTDRVGSHAHKRDGCPIATKMHLMRSKFLIWTTPHARATHSPCADLHPTSTSHPTTAIVQSALTALSYLPTDTFSMPNMTFLALTGLVNSHTCSALDCARDIEP